MEQNSKETKDLGRTIIDAVVQSEPSKDLSIEISEIAIDRLLDEGVWRDWPVVRSIVGVVKTVGNVRDALFVRKVLEFLKACPQLKNTERDAFVRKHLSDPEEAKNLRDALVLILEKLDDLQKPEMLAKMFGALMHDKIDFETFRRLAAAILIGFVNDLRLAADSEMPEHNRTLMANLIRTGLTEVTVPDTLTPAQARREIHYSLSQLGKVFIDCMRDIPSDEASPTQGGCGQ